MIQPFTHRALSPIHALHLDLDNLWGEIEAAREYGFNALQPRGEGDRDGFTEFRGFARANEVRDMGAVRRRREILQRT